MTAVTQEIIDRLHAAAGDTLRVHAPPDLSGAIVAGPAIDAYLVAVPAGYQVEAWRHHGDKPHRVEPFTELDHAVAAAVAAARDKAKR